MNRSAIRLAAACIAAAGFLGTASAQSIDKRAIATYPSRPVRFVVPFPPGGSNDALARMFARKLTEHWGQQVIVDNRPGAGSIIGSDIVAKAPADGYTILMVGQGYFLNPSLHRSLPYDTVKDFARVSMLVSTPSILAAHPSLKAGTVKALIAFAAANPGKLTYASPSVGSNGHLSMGLFEHMAGVRLVHVPYKGGGEALTAALGGQVQLLFTAPSSVGPHAKAGRLRALAVSSAKRIASLPDVPALAETLPGYEVVNIHGVLAPAKTPKSIVDRLHGELVRVLRLPEMRERLAGLDFDPIGSTPEEYTATTIASIPKYARLLKDAGIKPE